MEERRIVLPGTSVENTLVRYCVVEFLKARDEETALIALPLSKCWLCALEWAAVTCEPGGEASCAEVMQQWTMSTNRGEGLRSLKQDSRRTTDVFKSSVYHCEDSTRHFFRYASHIFWNQARLALWAALLCNMTLQCWWPLCACFLKRSSHIWSGWALISVVKTCGTLEGKSWVPDVLECLLHWGMWSKTWLLWGREKKLWSTLATETASSKLTCAINTVWQNTTRN